MAETYGPFVRLWGIEPSQLPPAGASVDALQTFISSLLQEALPFIASVPASEAAAASASVWQPKGVKHFPHSTAPVHLYQRTVPAADLHAVIRAHGPPGVEAESVHDETWALRRSVHEDKPARGTATWDEFVRCFKEEHAESEKEFTSSILRTQLDQEWDCSGITVELDGTTWTDLTLKREASLHSLPLPLKKRLFPVVQATAATQGRREFVVVQIAARPGDGETGDGENGIVRGAYTSVERVRETAAGLEWTMGTVSDARGVVPAWVQKMAVPGQIAKDVDMFLEWIDGERKK